MIKLIMACFTFCLFKKTLNWENTKPFIPNIKSAKVIKVYDGDTITIAAKIHPLDCKYYRFSVRLAHIDSPEIKSKDTNEKSYAIKAKTELEKIILNEYVQLKIIKSDKYGRLLAEIIYKNKSINDWMLANNLAVFYDGKKKSIVDWGKFKLSDTDFCQFDDFNHTSM
jgi:micrococcal nuclease